MRRGKWSIWFIWHNHWSENFAFRDVDIWQNNIVHRIKNFCLWKKSSKVEKQRHYISCHGLKVIGGMFTAWSISLFQYYKKNSEHEEKDHHSKALDIWRSTEVLTHDKHGNDKYQKNLHILKLITEEVLLCSEHEIVFQSHQEHLNYTKHYYEKWVNRGNFIAINTFAKLNPVLKDHLENGAKNAKMTLWKI